MKRLGNGFEQQLIAKLDAHPEAKLVIIDVYGKIRPLARNAGDSKQRDDEDFEPMVDIVTQRNVSLLILTHDRKSRDSTDFLANISGSYGIAGSSDTIWGIVKQRKEVDATFAITGRDVASQELAIRFNEETLRWEYQGAAADIAYQKELDAYETSAITQTIRKLLKQNSGKYIGLPKDIKTASVYLDGGKHQIHCDEAEVGRFINNNSHLFDVVDGVSVTSKRVSKGMSYTFSKE